MINHWTTLELQTLKDNYRSQPINTLAQHLNRSRVAVYNKAKKLGIFKINLTDTRCIISDEFEQVLIGSLLGDGYIYRCNNKRGTFGYYYSEQHSLKQESYAQVKIQKLGEVLHLYHWHSSYEDKRTDKTYNAIHFKSQVSPLLAKYHNLIYPNNKKGIQIELLNILKPQGIAFWFMDDGCFDYGTNNISLATNCFTLNEHQLLQSWFKSAYDIDFKIQEYKGQYLLRANNQDSRKFIILIEQYILPEMNYKIGKDEQRQSYAKTRREVYREDNKEVIKERHKKARETPAYKNRVRQYALDNRDHLLVKSREWQSKNKDKLKAYHQKYVNKDIDKSRARWREYYNLHKDEINTRKRERRRKTNLERLQ